MNGLKFHESPFHVAYEKGIADDMCIKYDKVLEIQETLDNLHFNLVPIEELNKIHSECLRLLNQYV